MTIKSEEEEALKLAMIVCRYSPQRQVVIVQRMAQLLISDRGHSHIELLQWLTDDEHHTWNMIGGTPNVPEEQP